MRGNKNEHSTIGEIYREAIRHQPTANLLLTK